MMQDNDMTDKKKKKSDQVLLLDNEILTENEMKSWNRDPLVNLNDS